MFLRNKNENSKKKIMIITLASLSLISLLISWSQAHADEEVYQIADPYGKADLQEPRQEYNYVEEPQVMDREEIAQTVEMPEPEMPLRPRGPIPFDPDPQDPSTGSETPQEPTRQDAHAAPVLAVQEEAPGMLINGLAGSGCSLTHGLGISLLDLDGFLLALPLAIFFRRKKL